MNSVEKVNRSSGNINRNNNKELYRTINKTVAESKIFSIILEEYIKRGGNYNVQN